jgi:SP family galactose:H+ symporter-like MFS transporter
MSRFVVFAAALVAIGGSLFGYDAGVISGAILFIRQSFGLDTNQVELVVSAAIVGAVFGSIASGPLTDRFGRRPVLLTAAATFIVGALVSALAQNVQQLLVGRVLIGVAIGVTSYTVPLYISELAPPESRGWLVSLNQLAVTSGILIGYLLDFALAGSGQWRWMIGLAVVPASVLGLGLAFLPDTPRWLVSSGQIDKARHVLRRVLGRDDVSADLEHLRASTNGSSGGGWAELFNPETRTPLLVGLGLAIVQQVTGINGVVYYAPTLLQGSGFPSESGAILATAGIGLVNVVMTIVAMLTLDRLGRRPLLLGSLLGMVVSLGILGLGFRIAPSAGGSGLAVLSVACLMAYVGSFAVGLGPVFWLLIAEIFPTRVRGLAMSLATAANWAANLVVSATFLSVLQALGPAGAFWLFSAVALAAWVFVYRLVPETRGRSLEEIEMFWRKTDRRDRVGASS